MNPDANIILPASDGIMHVTANDNRLKYQDQLSDGGLAGLQSDQKADRFTTMSRQMWEDQKNRPGWVTIDGTATTDGTAQPAVNASQGSSGLSTANAVRGSSPTGITPNASNNYYIDPASGTAADRLGAIIKGQYNDKVARFDPIENALMQQTTYMNPNLAGREIGKAEADTMGTYDNIAGSQAIQLGRYGMSMTADQQSSSDRLNALGRTGAVVDAANNIRLKLVERNQQIASGSATSIGAALKS
ncbi:MAG: hypothetical protein HIU83_15765 [Proteobacteria bacterium]|nr:hypothetical protein [Pseudomonadota bacterium]